MKHRSFRWMVVLQVALAMVMILTAVGPAAHFTYIDMAAARLDPTLVEMARSEPEKLVRVIVWEKNEGNGAQRAVEDLEGQVVLELELMNAISAVLPAENLPALSRSADVRWVSLDAPMVSTNGGKNGGGTTPPPQNYFLDTLNVRPVWALGYQGQGVTIAVVDSGVFAAKDLQINPSSGNPASRVIVRVSFNPANPQDVKDLTGHGTHVAGIAGGSGHLSNGDYAGIAPKVNLIGLRVSDDNGMAYETDTVKALEWIFNNRQAYNIRVVNLSVQSTVMQSYHDSALNAAAEILWLNGIVVIAAAGNSGTSGTVNTIQAAPANDPFLITVGATDEKGDSNRLNDVIAPFTAAGLTQNGFVKPEILAPGKNIISILADSSTWKSTYPDRVVRSDYFRISGTSMAAPMVAGAAALLLQAEPNLTPDQVKYRLVQTGSLLGTYRYLNVHAAITTPTTLKANQGVIPHMLLAKMAMMAYWSSTNGGENIDWSAVNWNSVNWSSVNWNSVNWNSVNWNAVNWNAVNWNAVNWSSVNWNAVNWNSVNWNSVNWNSVNWNSVNWNAVNWNAVNWAP